MSLLAYIRGQRRGKAAHRIEREAMQDPFLAEALEGFDAVKGEHNEHIAGIRKRLSRKMRHTHLKITYTGIAASVALCLAIGSYFLLNRTQEEFIAQIESPSFVAEEIEVPVQEESAQAKTQQEPQPRFASGKEEHEAPQTFEKVSPPPSALVEAEVSDKMDISETAIREEETSAESAVAVEFARSKRSEKESPADTVMQALQENTSMKKAVAASPEAVNKLSSNRKPEPEIGIKAYKKYLKEALIRPSEGECAKIKGTVEVEFKINADSKPYGFAVKRSLCEAADREAIRLIEQGSRWTGDRSQTVTLEVKF
jgi:outer membrane biosynthesis protein TonB